MSIRSRKWRMAAVLTRPLPACARSCRARSMAVQARSIRAMASATSASLTISGGTRRTTLSPAPTVSSFSARNASTGRRSGPSHLQPDQQSFAAHLGDHRRMPVLDLGEPLLEQERDACARARGSPASAPRRAPRCPPPSRADCRRRSSRACRASCPWPPRRWPSTAPIGKPPPSPLASAMTSGVTPIFW